jgi:hypothetical protein
MATLKSEPTQHNSLDRLQIRKYKSKTLLFRSVATLKCQTVGGDNFPVVLVSMWPLTQIVKFLISASLSGVCSDCCVVGSGSNVAVA